MSEQWVPQAQVQRYDELLQQIGAALIGAAPQGWRRIDLGGPPVAIRWTSRPTSLGFEDQRDLTRKIADLLVVRAPADREEIRVMYRAAGNHEELVGHVIGLDGRLREWAAPGEVSDR